MPDRAARICACGAVAQPGQPCPRCSPARRRAADSQRPSARQRGYTTAWDKARAGYLAKHPLCVMCERLGETTLATVVDHIQPHRGDDKLFWDSTNWMALCADHHSGAKQSMEKRETTTTATTKVKAVLLCGPPGSGKREYIQRMRKSGDLVVDMDALFQALSGEPLYSQPAELLPYVAEARDAVVMRLARATAPVTAWLIGAGATRDARERIARPLAARVLVLATPPQACARRIMRDRDRSHLIAKVQPLIDRWWQDYEPSDGDTVIDALH